MFTSAVHFISHNAVRTWRSDKFVILTIQMNHDDDFKPTFYVHKNFVCPVFLSLHPFSPFLLSLHPLPSVSLLYIPILFSLLHIVFFLTLLMLSALSGLVLNRSRLCSRSECLATSVRLVSYFRTGFGTCLFSFCKPRSFYSTSFPFVFHNHPAIGF